jgi:hypothetical protein
VVIDPNTIIEIGKVARRRSQHLASQTTDHEDHGYLAAKEGLCCDQYGDVALGYAIINGACI